MKEIMIKYGESAAITFVSVFAMTAAPLIGTFSFGDGAWRAALVSLAVVAGRTALKAAYEAAVKPGIQSLLSKEVDANTQA